ncbi:MAG TPA: hypothetical protein VFV27_06745 [Nevskiaceae bacterium]|nr:hypothetical protein [Nevskiaceae bacterium]
MTRTAVLLGLLLGLALVPESPAQERLRRPLLERPEQTELMAPGRAELRPQISPGEAARMAQDLNGGGRVLSVDPAGRGYRVKLLKDGNVRVLHIDG